jgi:hypothetical protein
LLEQQPVAAEIKTHGSLYFSPAWLAALFGAGILGMTGGVVLIAPLRATGIGRAPGCGRAGPVFGPVLGGQMLRSGVPRQYCFSGFGLVVLVAAAATFTLSGRVASAQ